MPREGKKGKVTGVVRIASGLEDRSGGFLGKAQGDRVVVVEQFEELEVEFRE